MSSLKRLEDIENLEFSELKDLKKTLLNILSEVDRVLKLRRKEEERDWHFEFEACSKKDDGKPYAARLVLKDDNIFREFIELEVKYEDDNVCVSGNYGADVGEVIEERNGGKSANDSRVWYLIIEGGKKQKVATLENEDSVHKVWAYLKGYISIYDLMDYGHISFYEGSPQLLRDSLSSKEGRAIEQRK